MNVNLVSICFQQHKHGAIWVGYIKQPDALVHNAVQMQMYVFHSILRQGARAPGYIVKMTDLCPPDPVEPLSSLRSKKKFVNMSNACIGSAYQIVQFACIGSTKWFVQCLFGSTNWVPNAYIGPELYNARIYTKDQVELQHRLAQTIVIYKAQIAMLGIKLDLNRKDIFCNNQ